MWGTIFTKDMTETTGLKYHSLFKNPLDHINSPFLAELMTECCLPTQAFSHLHCCQAKDLTAYTCVNSRVGAGKGSSFAYVQSHLQFHLDIRACAALPISVWRKFLQKGSFKACQSQASSVNFLCYFSLGGHHFSCRPDHACTLLAMPSNRLL